MQGLHKTLTDSVKQFNELATAAGGTAIALASALSKLALGMAGVAVQSQRVAHQPITSKLRELPSSEQQLRLGTQPGFALREAAPAD